MTEFWEKYLEIYYENINTNKNIKKSKKIPIENS